MIYYADEPEEQTVDEQVSEPEENTKQMSDDEPDNPMEEEKPDSSHSADKEDSEDDDDDQPLVNPFTNNKSPKQRKIITVIRRSDFSFRCRVRGSNGPEKQAKA